MLRTQLRSPYRRIRAEAALALWEITRNPDELVPVLSDALRDEGFVMSYRGRVAIAALGQMGPAAKMARPRLSELTRFDNEAVRRSAVESLKKIPEP
jgi:HEAT repeat protein